MGIKETRGLCIIHFMQTLFPHPSPTSCVFMVNRGKHGRFGLDSHRIYPGVYKHQYVPRTKAPVGRYRARYTLPKKLFVDHLVPDHILQKNRKIDEEGVKRIPSVKRRTVHLGCYDDPEVAFIAVEMFLLNFVLECPWAAPQVKDFLNSLAYLPRDRKDLEPERTSFDGLGTLYPRSSYELLQYARHEVDRMFPPTTSGDDEEEGVDDLISLEEIEDVLGISLCGNADPC